MQKSQYPKEAGLSVPPTLKGLKIRENRIFKSYRKTIDPENQD
jgi:hypothetical protein